MFHQPFKKVLLSTSCQNKATFLAEFSFVNTPQGVSNSLLQDDSSSYARDDGEKSNHAAVSARCRAGACIPASAPREVMGTALPAPHSIAHPRVPCSEQAPSWGVLFVCLKQRHPDRGDDPSAGSILLLTWVLCLHQHAQQHLPRLEKRRLILSRGGFSHPPQPSRAFSP